MNIQFKLNHDSHRKIQNFQVHGQVLTTLFTPQKSTCYFLPSWVVIAILLVLL